jgi:hypothetical protein
MIGDSLSELYIRPSKSDPNLNLSMASLRNSVRGRRVLPNDKQHAPQSPVIRVYVEKTSFESCVWEGFDSSEESEDDQHEYDHSFSKKLRSRQNYYVDSTAHLLPLECSSLSELGNELDCVTIGKMSVGGEDVLQDMITIEGLRSLYSSCFSCGVSWQEDPVSLDCAECGGYAMQRPCPDCDGKCDSIWERNLSATHDSHKADWDGKCCLGDKSQTTAGYNFRSKTSLKSCPSPPPMLTSSVKVS